MGLKCAWAGGVGQSGLVRDNGEGYRCNQGNNRVVRQPEDPNTEVSPEDEAKLGWN